jgi:hypothetical protein
MTLLELAQSTAGTSEWRFKDVSTLIAQLPAGMSTKDAVALVQASAREIVAAMLANTNGFARISGSRGSRRLPSPTSRIAAFTGWVSARIAAFTGDTAVRAHARGRVGALGVASRGLAGFLRFPPREYQHNVTEAGRLP